MAVKKQVRGKSIDVAKRKRMAIFFDRDGTIVYDVGYPKAAEQVNLLPGVGRALTALKDRGIALVLVSNQSGIGRGYITPLEAEQVHQAVVNHLAEFGISLDGAYYCPHAPEEMCECRKPSPGMLLRAASELGLDLSSSFMIGDRTGDIKAGEKAGCKTIFIKHGQLPDPCEGIADYTARDWQDIVRYVLADGEQIVLDSSADRRDRH